MAFRTLSPNVLVLPLAAPLVSYFGITGSLPGWFSRCGLANQLSLCGMLVMTWALADIYDQLARYVKDQRFSDQFQGGCRTG